jgi:hypothetical protein
MQIENMISLGHVIVRLITPVDPQPLINELSTLGYGMTRLEGSGSFSSTVSVILMIVPRTELGRLLGILSTRHPDILYTVKMSNVKKGQRSSIRMLVYDPGILRAMNRLSGIPSAPDQRSISRTSYHSWRTTS